MNNDYELIYLAQENNEEAKEMLYQKYKNLIYSNAVNFIYKNASRGIEINDVLLELNIYFEKAISDFDQNGGASFSTFLISYLNNALKSYNRSINKKKNKILNESVPLEDDEIDYSNKLYKEEDTTEYMIFDKGNTYQDYLDNLKEKEREIVELIKDGYSYSEIADMLNKDIKYVYNIVYRIKSKLKEMI